MNEEPGKALTWKEVVHEVGQLRATALEKHDLPFLHFGHAPGAGRTIVTLDIF